MKPENVTLNECEQRMAHWLAKQRHAMNRQSGTQNQRVGPQSDEETDLEGIGAEIAFCRMMNVYPDLSLDGRPNHDAVFFGSTVDVKATKYRNGHLLAVRGKVDKPAEIYALMVGEFPSYRFAGLMPSCSFLLPERIADFGYGQSYAASQSDLQSIEDWLNDYDAALAKEEK